MKTTKFRIEIELYYSRYSSKPKKYYHLYERSIFGLKYITGSFEKKHLIAAILAW